MLPSLRRRSLRLIVCLALIAGVFAVPGQALADWDQQSTDCVFYTETSGMCWVTSVDYDTGYRMERVYAFWGDSYAVLWSHVF